MDTRQEAFEKVASGNWSAFEKRAAIPWKKIKDSRYLAGALAGAGLATGGYVAAKAFTGVDEGIESSKRVLGKSRYYGKMMKTNPDLQKYQPVTRELAFDVLHRFNAPFAQNPVIAGQFVRRAASRADESGVPKIDPEEVKSLLEARAKLQSISQAGVKVPTDMMGKALSQTHKEDPGTLWK